MQKAGRNGACRIEGICIVSCLSMRARAPQEAREGTKAADAHGTRTDASLFLSVIVPADGTSAAGGGTGDFGTSPILGQLSDKQLLACIFLRGVSIVKSNRWIEEIALIRVDDGVAAPFRCRSRRSVLTKTSVPMQRSNEMANCIPEGHSPKFLAAWRTVA